jgi:hypothetical protein
MGYLGPSQEFFQKFPYVAGIYRGLVVINSLEYPLDYLFRDIGILWVRGSPHFFSIFFIGFTKKNKMLPKKV